MGKGMKTIAMIMSLVMMLSLVSGCENKKESTKTSQDQTSSSEQKESSTTEGIVKLTMWVHETDSPEGEHYKKRVEDFNAANKGKIEVELTAIPRTGDASGYDDKVNAAITTKSLPDILTCDGPNVAAFAESGIISPITQYVKDMDLSDFNPDIVAQGTYNNEIYGFGAMDSSVAIYYNKDMFAAAGITAPETIEDAWTLDELYENSKKLAKDGAFAIDMNLAWHGEWNTYAFLPMVQSNGGTIVGDDGKTVDGIINSAEAVEALTFIKKMVDEKLVSATPETNGFETGKVAMNLVGSWETGALAKYPDINWGIMPYPISKEGATAVSPCGSWGFYMTTNCSTEKQQAAVELIKFMTNTDSCTAMYKANGMPPARASSFDQLSEFNEQPLLVLKDQLQKTAVARPLTKNYPIISDQFSKAIDNVVSGMDPKQALDDAANQINSLAE